MAVNKIVVGSDQGSYTPTNGARTIVLSGLSDTPTIEQIAFIYNYTQDTLYFSQIPGLAKCTISSLTITIDGSFPVLATGDDIHIQLWVPETGMDQNLDAGKVLIENNRIQTSEQDLLSGTPYELTASFADVGNEIDVQTVEDLILFLTIDIGTSTNVQIRILHKHESGGTEEYREIYLGSPTANKTTINLNDYEIASDADQLFKIGINVIGTSYIQIQAKDDANGDGQIDALYFVKY